MSLFASFGAARARLAELAARDREFLAFLASLAPRERHVVAFATVEWDGAEPDAFAALLRTVPRKRLLALVAPQAPLGAARFLEKVVPPVRSHRFYRALMAVAAEPNAAKCLRAAKRITVPIVRGLAEIEPALRVPGLAEALYDAEEQAKFRYAVAVVRRVRPDLQDRDIAEWIARVEPKREVLRRFRHLLERAPLPSAWPGTKRLRLLATVDEIKRTGSEFKNCFAKVMLPRVLSGRCALYRWHGREPAVASIAVDPFVGRVLDEVKGPGNRAVRPATRAAIVSECATAGIDTAPEWRGFLIDDGVDFLP